MIIRKCDKCGKEINENRTKFAVQLTNNACKKETIASTLYFDACDACLEVIKDKIADIYKLANI